MSVNQVSPINTNIQQQRKTGGAGKAIASAFIPGIGEFLDDRNKEGAFFLGTRIGTSIITSKINKNCS